MHLICLLAACMKTNHISTTLLTKENWGRHCRANGRMAFFGWTESKPCLFRNLFTHHIFVALVWTCTCLSSSCWWIYSLHSYFILRFVSVDAFKEGPAERANNSPPEICVQSRSPLSISKIFTDSSHELHDSSNSRWSIRRPLSEREKEVDRVLRNAIFSLYRVERPV